MQHEDDMADRENHNNGRSSEGRRTVDDVRETVKNAKDAVEAAAFLKWLPALALSGTVIVGLVSQTMYLTREWASFEATQLAAGEKITRLDGRLTGLEGKVDTLTSTLNQRDLPAAENSWKVRQLEAKILELQTAQSDDRRAAAERERRVQRLENASATTSARLRARDER